MALVVAAVAMLAAVAHADQPNMKEALQELRQARQELEQASEGREGHRARAIQHVDNAIDHVEQGMAVADDED